MEPETIELQENQSALILEADDNGEITVTVASRDHQSLTGALCQAIAHRLMNDEKFQSELMELFNDLINHDFKAFAFKIIIFQSIFESRFD